jgi:hypothetical protein
MFQYKECCSGKARYDQEWVELCTLINTNQFFPKKWLQNIKILHQVIEVISKTVQTSQKILLRATRHRRSGRYSSVHANPWLSDHCLLNRKKYGRGLRLGGGSPGPLIRQVMFLTSLSRGRTL